MPHTLYLFHKNNRVEKLKTNLSHVCKKFLNTLSIGPQQWHLTMHYFTKNSTSLEQASNEQTKYQFQSLVWQFFRNMLTSPMHHDLLWVSMPALHYGNRLKFGIDSVPPFCFKKRICSLVIEIMLTCKNSAIFEQFFTFSKTNHLSPAFSLHQDLLLYTNKI